MKLYYNLETFSEKLQKLLPESNFTLLTWAGIKQPASFICHTCNNTLYYAQADKIVDRSRRGLKNVCRICEDTAQQKPRLAAIAKIDNILKKKKTLELKEDIVSLSKEVSWFCTKCKHSFTRQPQHFLKNSKCPWCEGCFPVYTIDIVKQLSFDQWGSEYDVLSKDYNYNRSVKIKVKHNVCGFIYDVNVHNFTRGHGCPRCKSSSGERLVRQFLEKEKIVFQEQYRFKNSVISHLSFDFYLEVGDEKKVIEYNGIQHYQPVDFFGGDEAFVLQQDRDQQKIAFCQKNNIELITIPYYDTSILSNELAQRLRGEGA